MDKDGYIALNETLRTADYKVVPFDGKIEIHDLQQPDGSQHIKTVFHIEDVLWFLLDEGVVMKREF